MLANWQAAMHTTRLADLTTLINNQDDGQVTHLILFRILFPDTFEIDLYIFCGMDFGWFCDLMELSILAHSYIWGPLYRDTSIKETPYIQILLYRGAPTWGYPYMGVPSGSSK